MDESVILTIGFTVAAAVGILVLFLKARKSTR
jgi:hypothetical protein